MYAFVFDFDGPIFGGRAIAQAALEETVMHFQQHFGCPEIAFTSLPLLNPKQMISVMYAELGLNQSDVKTIEDHYREQLDQRERYAVANSDLKRILNEMNDQSVPMAIFSARMTAQVEEILTGISLRNYFRIVVGRDLVPHTKPAPDGLKYIAEHFRLSPTQLVVIGDSDADYEAARAAGSFYYHAQWTGELASKAYFNADATIPLCTDLYEVMESAAQVVQTVTTSLPIELEGAIKAGEFSFYAGAGVSVPSGIGGWTNHYGRVFEKLRARMLAGEMELEDALQLLSASKPKAVFDEFKDSFLGRHANPNSYHYAMLRSCANHIWTSNYDGLFELANQEGHFDRTVIKNDETLLNNFRNRRVVIKMNGDFEGAAWNDDLDWDLVFLREQFDRSELKRSEIWRTFEDDYRNRSMILVGLSFTDSALRRIVSVQRRRVPRTRHPHYFVVRKPHGPLAQRKALLHAANLRRLHIETLFMDSHDDVDRFVKRAALLSVRPVIAICGSLSSDAAGGHNYQKDAHLPNGLIDLGTIEKFCSTIGFELASSKSFRVTSGGAPGVGLPAVRSAFEANPSLARFYLRQKGTTVFDRSAPSVIVPGADFGKMRERLNGEASLIIAVGGMTKQSSGLSEEIEMALRSGVPILLVPQGGGTVYDVSKDFKHRIAESYYGDDLRRSLYEANSKIASVPGGELVDFARLQLPSLVEEVLLQYVGSRTAYKATPAHW